MAIAHARRERTFLALAALILAGIAALVGGSNAPDRTIDVTSSLSAWFDLPALELPIAALALPLALATLGLVRRLYGPRRAVAVARAGAIVGAVLVGVAAIGDAVDDRSGALPTALAYGAAAFVALFVTARLGGRALAQLAGTLGGWAAFAGAAYALGALDLGRVAAIAYGAAAYGAIAALVVAPVVVAVARRALGRYLRVGFEAPVVVLDEASGPRAWAAAAGTPPGGTRKPRALIVDTPIPGRERPFTTAEYRFFEEGEALSAEAAAPASASGSWYQAKA